MSKISIDIQSGQVTKTNDMVAGIDLGTTNSLVAFVIDGEAQVLKIDGKHALVPSVLNISENDITVGQLAKDQLISDASNTIFSVKRLMGKKYSDIVEDSNHLPYKIIDLSEESMARIEVNGKYYNPVELSAEILKKLKKEVEKQLGNDITKAVITVPAYFNDSQRQATKDAGKIAGWDVLRIINEPTAASLAYGHGLSQDTNKTVAVYDMGGGTFDVTILNIEGGVFEVLATNGNTFLGGDDIDQAVIKHWAKKYDFSLENLDSSKKQAIRLLAEEAKRSLNQEDVFKTTFMNQSIELTQAEYSVLIQPILEETFLHFNHALKDAQLKENDIDEIILVGGSTKSTFLKNALKTNFSCPINDTLNPDEAVALGAAIQGDILAGNRSDLLLLDVTPLSLGIETVGGLMDVILPRNSKVPQKLAREYTTSIDGQKNLKISIFQGERDLVQDNRKLGEFILSDIPSMAAGIPKIRITFSIDIDGILSVSAQEMRSGKNQKIKVHSTYGISEDEMGKMLMESMQYAEADMKIKALTETRVEAKGILQATEKFKQQNVEWLTNKQLEKINALANDLNQSLESENKDDIVKEMDRLNQYTSPLAQKAMEHTIKKALAGKKI